MAAADTCSSSSGGSSRSNDAFPTDLGLLAILEALTPIDRTPEPHTVSAFFRACRTAAKLRADQLRDAVRQIS